jgi:phosphatidylglycerol---prolipoprotein diacylglyceryl transferase
MYPSISDLLHDVFGVNWKLPIQTFGFFVAIAFLAAAYVLTKELRRREKLGWLAGIPEEYWVGKPASNSEIFINAFIGFLLGYKLLPALMSWDSFSADPQHYILSSTGNWWGGIIVGAVIGGWRYYDKKRHQLKDPVLKQEIVMPHQRVGDFTVIAAIGGLVGAKLFDSIENWRSYMSDPLHSFFSFSGLAYYGGLIVAAIAIIYYARTKKINSWHLIDSAAPALILAYGLGRIGCHMAGDGDWGIYNSAYMNDGNGGVVKAPPGQFAQSLHKYQSFFLSDYGSLSNVRHAYFAKPGFLHFLPNWLFAFNYPHNINSEGIPIPGCIGAHCSMLPTPVFPTPLYEITMCLILFGILWAIRKKIKIPGLLFGIYLIFTGVERFFIEIIRVNPRDHFLGVSLTQAQIISLLLIATGVILVFYCKKKHPPLQAATN